MICSFVNASHHCCRFAFSPPPSPSPLPVPLPPSRRELIPLTMAASVRIAVVGDVHNDWDLEEDSKAIEFLQLDLLLFTGDFGEENVELVRSIAELKIAKAAILGNHDAWYTHQFSTKEKDGVQLQLESLGDEHVGYKRLDFPALKLSVVGGRPFSSGGNQLFRKRLLKARYQVSDMNASAQRIRRAASGTPEDHSIIILAHNGPKGLGSEANDICGKDWVHGGGDHGDPDLAQALSLVKETTNHATPLVIFGHMHKELRFGGLRKMISIGDDNTMYLNGAVVPRVKRLDDGSTIRAFTLVEFSCGTVARIVETWVSVAEDKTSLAEQEILFHSGSEASSSKM